MLVPFITLISAGVEAQGCGPFATFSLRELRAANAQLTVRTLNLFELVRITIFRWKVYYMTVLSVLFPPYLRDDTTPFGPGVPLSSFFKTPQFTPSPEWEQGNFLHSANKT